ncbi:MAG: aa3-type cytochrome c oxidase subunit IV [Pseudolabrys sp.]|nr:aa3-type cytochrome c oxidase subunit IV [Pseudolabrys sp.]MBV9261000.1 aa3-type cytochrome c oxidase subunit IV [Pseudolabrys sp.]
MADHGNVEYATAPGNDYPAHEHAYVMFLKLVKWHVIIIPIILILMAYFLV